MSVEIVGRNVPLVLAVEPVREGSPWDENSPNQIHRIVRRLVRRANEHVPVDTFCSANYRNHPLRSQLSPTRSSSEGCTLRDLVGHHSRRCSVRQSALIFLLCREASTDTPETPLAPSHGRSVRRSGWPPHTTQSPSPQHRGRHRHRSAR